MQELFIIEGTEYRIYQAASGDSCVEVSRYGEQPEQYNLGTYAEALHFILEEYEEVAE